MLAGERQAVKGWPRPFARAFDLVAAPHAMRRFVVDELSSPARHWHGLLHHALMLRDIAGGAFAAEQRVRLILAVLFHDIVYDATRSDNEERSADFARKWIADDRAEAVATLFLATKHRNLATDPLTRALLFADLRILWTPSPPLYAFYAAGIRREYRHVPDAAYRAGRAAVLDQLATQLRAHLEPGDLVRLYCNMGWEAGELAAGAFDLAGSPPTPA